MHCTLFTWTAALLTLSTFAIAQFDTDEVETYGQSNTNWKIRVWAVEIDGGDDAADAVAQQYGVRNLGQIGGLRNYYNFLKVMKTGRSRRSTSERVRITRSLERDARVSWVREQNHLVRTTRSSTDEHDQAERGLQQSFSDPLWNLQWYMNPSLERQKGPVVDLNVASVWKQGITGRGVVVTVVDDGLDWKHSDLRANYDQEASTDLNEFDSDPTPSYDGRPKRHGTRCGGEIAMVANNSMCGVGVAYNAKLGGIRMLDGFLSDSLEAAALSFNVKHIDIYSNSWGPTDDGQTMERPGPLTRKAIEAGISQGRGGKGALYVWAAGNGASFGDNCNFDGYVSSQYSFTIAAVSQGGKRPYYSERCAAVVAATYSSGASGEKFILSTDLEDSCTDEHSGTSAAAPLASGIFALLLERNSNLTWRDVKHIVARTARHESLRSSEKWRQNGAGFWLNDAFGFGLLDAHAMISLANPQTWINVPAESKCSIPIVTADKPREISTGNPLRIDVVSNGCKNSEREVVYIEHVILKYSLDYSQRGDFQITLTSPSGYKTALVLPRKSDKQKAEIDEWQVVSVHSWGESPVGKWTIDVFDESKANNDGKVRSMELTFRGTKELPPQLQLPRKDRQDSSLTKDFPSI